MAATRKTQIIKVIGATITIVLTAGTPVGMYYGGISWFGVGFFLVTGYFCMLTQEAFYHRYFAHQSFKTSRTFQFIMGILAELAPVRGPIWWAANHRDHHKYTDTERDPHTPTKGWWQSYMGWVYTDAYIAHNYKNAADLTRYKELRIIDKLFWVPMLVSFILCYWLGSHLEQTRPELGTNGLQLLVFGGFMRVLYPIHIMAWINYFTHSTYYNWGYRNFDSPDTSRNVWFLGILGAGVGWHNNHHKHGRYASTRVMWWEIDASAALIWVLEKCGIVWNVRWIPESYREEARAYRALVAAHGEPEPRIGVGPSEGRRPQTTGSTSVSEEASLTSAATPEERLAS